MSLVARQRAVNGERPIKHHLTLPYSTDDPPHANSSLMLWTRHVSLSLPGGSTRRLRIPNVRQVHQLGRRVGRRRKGLLTCLFIFSVGLVCFLVARHIRHPSKPTLVFGRENLQEIWRWEVASGHHPSEVQGAPRITRECSDFCPQVI